MRLPNSLCDRRRHPLPTSSTHHPWLTVECRPAASGPTLAARGGTLAAGGGALVMGGGAPAAGCGTPAASGGALDEGEMTALLAAALIEDLAPRDMTLVIILSIFGTASLSIVGVCIFFQYVFILNVVVLPSIEEALCCFGGFMQIISLRISSVYLLPIL